LNTQPNATPASQDSAVRTLNPVLKEFLDEVRGFFRVALAFSFFTNLLVLTVPLYMLQVYDRVLTSQSVDTLLLLTLIAVVALLALSLLDTSRAQLVARLGYRLDQRISSSVIMASIRGALSRSSFPSVKGMRDIAAIRNLLTTSAATAVLDLPWMPLFFVVIFLLHPVLGWLAVAGCLLLLVTAWFGEVSNREQMDLVGHQALGLVQQVENSARSADAFEAMGISSRWIDRWAEGNLSHLKDCSKVNDRNSLVLAVSRFFRMGLQVAVLGVGAFLVLEGEITAGVMIAAAILTSRALTPVEQSISSFRSLMAARQAFAELGDLLDQSPANKQSLSLPRPAGTLEVEKVTYFHPGASEPCLYGIDFKLAAGESMGLIGPSGAGKSTLSRLLVGTSAPRLGHVRLDGMDIAQWDASDRGQYIGYLPQDVGLISGTVLENICRMHSDDQEKVIAAAKLAGVHDLIIRLENGYETEVGDQGLALSAGQRQRIGLARALYGDIAFVLLDEPNAHLDHDGEVDLIEALDKLKEAGVTTIVVAQRPSVIQKVDKLAVLRNGRLAAFGPREDIMASVVPSGQKTEESLSGGQHS